MNTLPEHLDTPENHTFLDQVLQDYIDAGETPTTENLEQYLKNRLERNQRIADSQDARDLIREKVA